MVLAFNPYGTGADATNTGVYPPVANNFSNNQVGAVADSHTSVVRYQIPWNSIEVAQNTTSSTAIAVAGAVTITVASATFWNLLSVGQHIYIDGGNTNKAEDVVITGLPVSTQISFTCVNTHTTTPYAVETQPPAGATPNAFPKLILPYNWSVLDNLVTKAVANGFVLHMTIEKAPRWHLSNLPAGVPGINTVPTPTDCPTYITQVLQRIIHDNNAPQVIAAVGVTNEGYDASTTYTGADLFAMVLSACQNVYQAVKAIAPWVLVVSPATIHRNTPYLESWWQAFYAAGCGPFVDVLQFHYYPSANTSTNPGTADAPNSPSIAGIDAMNQFMTNLQAIKTANGDAAKPIWMTETGYTLWKNPPGTNGGIIDSQFALYLEQILQTCITQPAVQLVSLFNMSALAPGFPNDFSALSYQTWKSFIQNNPTWPVTASTASSSSGARAFQAGQGYARTRGGTTSLKRKTLYG